jgi:hypothetical protein
MTAVTAITTAWGGARSLANPGYRPPPDPCALPKAMLVVEQAKDVSQPDS